MEEYLPAWYKAYVTSNEVDRHTVFSNLTGLSRGAAKELCYKIAYSIYKSDIIKAYIENEEK